MGLLACGVRCRAVCAGSNFVGVPDCHGSLCNGRGNGRRCPMCHRRHIIQHLAFGTGLFILATGGRVAAVPITVKSAMPLRESQ